LKLNRNKRPDSSGGIDFKLSSFNRNKLANGIEYYLIEKRNLPIVRLSLLVECGSKFDLKNQRGLANLVSMCVDEGAGDLNALQIADQFEMLGAHFSVYVDNDHLYLTLQSLSENFRKAFEVFRNIVTTPHLNVKDFDREKRKLLTRFSQLKDEPDYLAGSAFTHSVFGVNHPYSHSTIGVSNDVTEIQNNDIRKFYSKYFSPENSVMVIVGDLDENEILDVLQKNFSTWKGSKPEQDVMQTNHLEKSEVVIVDKKDSVQTEIRVGHLCSKRNQKDYFQRLLLNTVLGGQFTSRINLNLREKHGYTYGAFSRFNYLKDAANFIVSTSVGIDNTADALKEIFNELHNIKNGVTDEELSFAKSSIINKFPSNFETYGQVLSNFTSKIICELPDDYFNTYLENIKNVQIDDVNIAANENIHPDKLLTVLAGDKTKILKQIDKNKFGEIKEFDIKLIC
jgi:zinc protease